MLKCPIDFGLDNVGGANTNNKKKQQQQHNQQHNKSLCLDKNLQQQYNACVKKDLRRRPLATIVNSLVFDWKTEPNVSTCRCVCVCVCKYVANRVVYHIQILSRKT